MGIGEVYPPPLLGKKPRTALKGILLSNSIFAYYFSFSFFTEGQTTYILIYSPFTNDTYNLNIKTFWGRLFSFVHCLIPDCMVCMMGVLKYGGSHSSINQSRYHLTLYKRLPHKCVYFRIAHFLLSIVVKSFLSMDDKFLYSPDYKI